MNSLWQDISYGFRVLRKNPGFTCIAVLTLALGIGANTAIFSVVNAVLLQPLPYTEGKRLVQIKQPTTLEGVEHIGMSPVEFEEYQSQNTTMDRMAEFHSMWFILLGHGEPERVQTGVVSAHFFDMMGVQPLHGRTFREGEDKAGAEPVLVLSYKYWQRSFGGDPSVVGRDFEMNDRIHKVVGVLPPIPEFPAEQDVYMPVSACPFRMQESTRTGRGARIIAATIGRMKEGVTRDQTEADLKTIAGRMASANPNVYAPGRGFTAAAFGLQEELTKRARPTFLILLGTTAFVLLIACANVANLMLARLIKREHELAVRTALGADRMRLLRQLVTEATMLSLTGGAVGLFFASWGLEFLSRFASRFTPRADEIGIDPYVLLFTLGVSVATGIFFGAFPAFRRRENTAIALKEEGTRGNTSSSGLQAARSALIVGQVAISFILLIGAGLMVRTLIKLNQVDGGFRVENVLTSQLSLNFTKYTTPAQRFQFTQQVLDRVRVIPGVQAAGVGGTFPLNGSQGAGTPNLGGFLIENRAVDPGQPQPQADYRFVSPGYFEALDIQMVSGRPFNDQDQANTPQVFIVNQSMAKHYWPNEDPIGKRVSVNNGQTYGTVVGMVRDVKQYGLGSTATDELYLSFAQFPILQSRLVIRTAGDPMAVARQMREAVYSVDPGQPVSQIQTMEQVRSESLASPKLTTILIGMFSVLALAITCAGIGGVMAIWVNQRTQEIGIRMALGAQKGDVLRLVLGQGMRLLLFGLALGIGGAVIVTRSMNTLLYGVKPTDPVSFGVVLLVLAGVAVLACYAPARRATKVDPMVALRYE